MRPFKGREQMIAYIRTTHDANGHHKGFPEEAECHWHAVGHLLQPHRPMAIAEIVSEATEYNRRYFGDGLMETDPTKVAAILEDMATHGFVARVN